MNDELQRNLIQRLALGDGIRRSASRTPNNIAIIEPRNGQDLSVTYREFNDQLNRFVRAMRELGLNKGDKIACLGPNSIEFAECLYGCFKGAFVFVPINFMMQSDGMLHVLNDSGAKVFIFDDAMSPVVQQVMDAAPADVEHFVQIPITGTPMLEGANVHDFNTILNRQSSDEIEDVIIWERDIAEMAYTSGSTAAPKAVMISHMAMYLAAIQTLVEMSPDLTVDEVLGVMALPIFHCGARAFVTSHLFLGGTVVFFRDFDPAAILSGVERLKISFLGGLPMMWAAVYNDPNFEKHDLSTVKAGLYGMAPMDETTLDLLTNKHGIRLYLSSGQTEFSPPTNYRKPEWQTTKKGNYWGTPGLLVDGAIMDDDGNLLPPGEVGEIVWRGPACMEEYRNNPEATAKSRKFGWHHSEDLGLIDEDGLLLFVDRKKDMIKTGGENVATIKIEEWILNEPRVAAVAVLGIPHERWTEAVTAFVVTFDQTLTEDDIISHCKQSLSAFEVPKKVVFVSALPTTSTGKIRKVDLRGQYQDIYKNSLT